VEPLRLELAQFRLDGLHRSSPRFDGAAGQAYEAGGEGAISAVGVEVPVSDRGLPGDDPGADAVGVGRSTSGSRA
jgi:hypothetical protein